jgi:hypothetical protein
MAKTFDLSQVLSGMEIDAPSASAYLTLNTITGGQSIVTGEEAGKSRWQIVFGDTTPETGGDVGSNFDINAYHDNGSYSSTPLTINRQTGAVTIPKLEVSDPSGIQIAGGESGNVLTTDGDGGLYWSDAGTVGEAPQDSQIYGRSDGGWVASAIQSDTPADGILYGRKNTLWEAIPPPGISDAPKDGQIYGRQSANWVLVAGSGSVGQAPADGTTYARNNNAWVHIAHTDITDWTATLAPYALTTSIPGASSSVPIMDGAGLAGTGTTWARADHQHPSDTTKYNASNPAGYQTATQVTAAITAAAYVLPTASTAVLGGVKVDGTTISITGGVISSMGAGGGISDAPNDATMYARKSQAWAHLTHNDITDWAGSVTQPSTTTPLMDGTAVVGVGTTWARADHIHPSDTSRYPATNPAGYQTAAQVSASLANYLPLGGGTLTGPLYGTNATFSGTVTAAVIASEAPSDARIKRVLDEYRPGLDAISRLRPVAFAFKGNDTSTPGGVSPHYEDARENKIHIGLVAQEVEQAIPGMVSTHKGYIDGHEVYDLRHLNSHELIYALINAVKELKAEVDALKRR